MSDQLKAYQVNDEKNACVVFAAGGAEACSKGAADLGLSLEEVESCRRAPEFDAYAPGPVPQRALYDAGWWFECGHCGDRVSQDDLAVQHEGRCDAEGNDAEPGDFSFFERGRRVFCCRGCMAKEDAEQRERKAREAALVELVLAKYPEASVVIHAYPDPRDPRSSTVRFALPGLLGDVRWSVGEPTVLVERRDEEAFRRLYGAGTPRAS